MIVERTADLLIGQQMKRRFAQTDKPRSAASDAATRDAESCSRHVPRAVVREVHAREGGQCAFVSPEGRRCAARGHLELHHDVPYIRGGAPTLENIVLVCRAHNALFAERDFGRTFMRDRMRSAREGLVPEQ